METEKTGAADVDRLDEMRLEYAWNWFDFHAKQRMQLFYFFLIITGILGNAYVGAYNKIPIMSFAVCLLGSLQAFGFLIFDIRSRELTRYAEDVLEKLERDRLFPKDFTHPEINKGERLGLLYRDSVKKMREGYFKERGWSHLRKMKVWIQAMEVIVGLSFLVGLFIAICVQVND